MTGNINSFEGVYVCLGIIDIVWAIVTVCVVEMLLKAGN
jgi:hypothetical protein